MDYILAYLLPAILYSHPHKPLGRDIFERHALGLNKHDVVAWHHSPTTLPLQPRS